MPVGLGTAALTAVGLGTLGGGLTAGLVGGALIGAGVGAVGSAIEGGNVGEGALFGGLLGGVSGGAEGFFAPAASAAGAAGSGASAASVGGGAADAAGAAGGAGASTVELTAAQATDAGLYGLNTGTAGISGAGTLTGAQATDAGLYGLDAGNSGISATGAATPVAASGGDASMALQSLGQGGGVAGTSGGVSGSLPSAQDLLTAPSTSGGVAGAGGASSGLSGAPSFTQGGGSLLDKLASGAEGSIAKNPLGTAISAGGFLMNTMKGNQQSSQQKALAHEASAFSAQQNSLLAPLTTGQLPPGAQAAVNQGVASAKAAVQAKYASLGLSGSTMEAQDLANIDMQAQSQAFALAGQLFQSGMSEANISTQIYNDLLGIQQQQSQQTGQAISNLAGALSGGGSANQITLKIP